MKGHRTHNLPGWPYLRQLWHPAPAVPMLSENDIHIWCASLDQEMDRVDEFFHTLSPDEQQRAQRFYFERHRRHFTVGRGILREILSRYLAVEPQRLVFSYGLKGKPSLAPECLKASSKASELRFNLSHSGGLALYAFIYGRDIGVDVEQLRQLDDAENIARRFFSASEVQVFCSLPAQVRIEGFFNCWTRKEAYIKATGDGLSTPLDRFAVTLRPGEAARFVHIDGKPVDAARWFLRELHPASGYVAAVCVEGQGGQLTCWSWG